jgi:DNA-binding NtrC family response regulator
VTPPRLVLLDLRLPDLGGVEVLRRLRSLQPQVAVAIVTGHPALESALAAIKGQVVDYLCKPVSLTALDDLLDRVFGQERPARPPEPPAAAPALQLVGVSAATAALRDLIQRLAHRGVRAALITGESGTGKELAARLLHADGPRSGGPFVDVNCSAVSEALFESEFFGHERGAFTGAVGTRRGLVQMADGGTLFLDEVAEIPPACQAKLLRFLDDGSFLRVGGSSKIRVDVRVVAATNRDLRAMVRAGTFREDLYFRLNVAPIALTPLRERREDILPLARHWLDRANTGYGRRIAGFTPEAERLLLAHDWPGNVRELRNVVERAVILCPDDHVTGEDLALDPGAGATTAAGGPARTQSEITSLDDLSRAHMQRILAHVNGNKTQAARILGISRQTLRTRLVPPAHD